MEKIEKIGVPSHPPCGGVYTDKARGGCPQIHGGPWTPTGGV